MGDRFPFAVDFFGLRYRGHLGNHIDRQVYFFGAYESDELAFVRAWWGGRQGGIALDVGANVGHHTLALSQIFASVHAFEPNPDPLAALRQKIESNGILNVVVHPVGLWDRDAELPFNVPPSSNTGMGSFKETIECSTGVAPLALPVRPGDDVLQEHGVERIDFLKIDVQGAEKEVVTGLRQTIKRSRPLIWIEISDTTRRDFPTMASLVDSLGTPGYAALCHRRRWRWLNVTTPETIDEEGFRELDGNLLLRPILDGR
jgi:FkbM family methyltransferase